jgi:hypothetical protein
MPRETFANYAVKSIAPVTGWQAVYHEGDTHFLGRVYALALAYRHTRDAHTRALVPAPIGMSEDELWEIVGLDYHQDEGWVICEASSNCCGLLPPDMTLAEFEAQCPFHTHSKQITPDGTVSTYP